MPHRGDRARLAAGYALYPALPLPPCSAGAPLGGLTYVPAVAVTRSPRVLEAITGYKTVVGRPTWGYRLQPAPVERGSRGDVTLTPPRDTRMQPQPAGRRPKPRTERQTDWKAIRDRPTMAR